MTQATSTEKDMTTATAAAEAAEQAQAQAQAQAKAKADAEAQAALAAAAQVTKTIKVTKVIKAHPLPACPHCGHSQCPVYKGATEYPTAIVRRRRCRKCGHTFKTTAQVNKGMVGPEVVEKS